MKKIIRFAILLIAVLSVTFSNAQQIITLNPVQDAYFLSFGGGEGGNAMLKFDISSIPVGASINSVTLEVYVADTTSGFGPAQLGNMIFKNLNVQGWTENDSASWYDPSTPTAPTYSDSIFQLANFGDSIGWTSSVDLSPILLRDYNSSNNFCTVYMKDPDDMTCCGAFGPGFTPFLGNLQDSIVVGNSIGGSDQIVFYPREYTNASLIPKLIINYDLGLEISEIMYNPPEAGTDSLEFIEIYNNSSTPVDVTNYTLSGVTYTFPNTSINPGQYYVVAVDQNAFNTVFGFMPDGQFGGALSNSGEALTIKDNFGNLVDTVFFDDSGVWPSGASAGQPDGGGSSLILCDVNSDNNDGANWNKSVFQTSVIINGFEVLASPGSTNFCCPILTGTDTQTSCDSLLWMDGNTYYVDNNTATFTVKNATNCDSTITLNLTINYSSTNSQNITICNNDSIFIGGNYQTTSGVYYDSLISSMGCDSIIITTLMVDTVYATISTTSDDGTCNGSILVTPTNGIAPFSYSVSPGGSFNNLCAGVYCVTITDSSGCSYNHCDTVQTTVGINDPQLLASINIYPNPTDNMINITWAGLNASTNLTLSSIDGKIVYHRNNISDNKVTIDVSNYSKGIYFLHIETNEGLKVYKVIKQ